MNVNFEDEIQTLRSALQDRLDELLCAGEQRDRVYVAMREGALAAGKRMRPLLLMLTARDLGCDIAQPGLLDLACAVEMVHAASLILDDIPCMDNSLMRRGQPTVHLKYGQDVAILAAVALLSRSFGVIAEARDLPCECKTRAIAELSLATGIQGLVQGQYLDLNESTQPRSVEAVMLTNELKTSRLFDASLQMAAIVSDASLYSRQQLHYFACDLGQAFQLMDDLTDGLSGTGKDSDKDQGKSTLVAMLGAGVVHQRLREHLSSAEKHLTSACEKGFATRHFMRVWFNKQMALFGKNRSQPLTEH